ncbi:MAG: TolC family protein [Pseudomonadota bacterium]|nr:TolC family protein [Pseudomonadota bacterium]
MPVGVVRSEPLFKLAVDPFGTEAGTAPAARTPWEGAQPLPAAPSPAFPSANEVPKRIVASLPELTEIALANHPTAREAWAAARAQAAELGIFQADYLPQLSGNLGVTHSQSLSSSGVSVPSQTRYGPNVSLSYVLFDFGVRANQVEAARYRLLAANLIQNRVLQDIVLAVEQTYYQLLGFEQLLSANRLTLKNAETSLQAANGRRKAGLATSGDVFRAQTAAAQARLALQRTEGEVAKSRGQLANAIGMPVGTEFVLEPWREKTEVEDLDRSIEGLLDQAKQNRPDLISAEAEVRAARAATNAVAATGLPTLELGATTGRTLFTDDRGGISSYSIGLNLRIPIFTGFRNTYQVRQAKAFADQAEAQRDALFRDTELGVWQAYFDLKTAYAALASAESLLASANLSAEAALARYKVGVGSLLELITAQADQANARVQVIQAQLDWYTGFARLNHALGSLPQS